MMSNSLENSWAEQLAIVLKDPRMQQLALKLKQDRLEHTVYPPSSQVFEAFNLTGWNQVKVVILGQDPYHAEGQAHGLAFSVPKGMAIPPSLLNIYKELHNDLQIEFCSHGNLKFWADQGVLLLNSVLTVRKGLPQSHQNWGWEWFTDQVIAYLSQKKANLVFLLWGNSAKLKAKAVNREKHLVLQSVHPSPLSFYKGFMGCAHFSKTNQYLIQHGLEAINWNPDGNLGTF